MKAVTKPPAKGTAVTTAGKPRKSRRRFGRGSLVLIAALFAASAAIRFGEGVGQAFAVASEPEAETAVQNAECTTDAGVMALLKDVQAREEKVASREKSLADRSQAIGLAEKRIEDRLAALVAAEQKLAQTLAIADKAADEDVTKLVTLYENMKPKDAAPLFATMAPEFAAGFLARMRPDTSAAVMANLDPQIAYSISVIMAGRNAGAPEN